MTTSFSIKNMNITRDIINKLHDEKQIRMVDSDQNGLELFSKVNWENTTDENTIDGLSSCMRIVNSIKKDLELYSLGKKTKDQIDSTFIEWDDPVIEKETPIYESEIDEAYEKKFGNKALIQKLIQELEYNM